MTRFAALLLCSCTAACFDSNDAGGDIVGPYTGARTRYVVDSMRLPMNNNEARMHAADLNGDKVPDNQLGMVMGTLFTTDTADRYTADRIAAGEIAMSIEIQADNLDNDDAAGVWVYGFDGADARSIGGTFVDGTFIPNFVRDTDPDNTGSATLALALLEDADASRFEMPHMQISLVPDGRGGYDAQIHGVIREPLEVARLAVYQQQTEKPELHRWMWTILDPDRDGTIEWPSSLFQSLLAPDIEIDGEDLLSVGFSFHLTACPEGNCALATPANTCHDRVVDNGEVDVDCGGDSACGGCGPDLACVDGDDCQSGTCTGGTCTAPTCFDGRKNGYEAAVDCGGACARKCELDAPCGMDLDCASGHCTVGGFGEPGTGICIAP